MPISPSRRPRPPAIPQGDGVGMARRGAAMAQANGTAADGMPAAVEDALLFGWDPAPGIVSVWADHAGRARLWQRAGGAVRCTEGRFRPWLFAAGLDDLRHLGPDLVDATSRDAGDAPFSYRRLDGPPGSLRFLLAAR